MNNFLIRKQSRSDSSGNEHEHEHERPARRHEATQGISTDRDEDSTELKLAILISLHPDLSQDILFEALLEANGDVDAATAGLSAAGGLGPRLDHAAGGRTVGHQSTLTFKTPDQKVVRPKPLTQKGRTLYLYSPRDIEQHTPCSIIHNFLPAEDARALLRELLAESHTFQRETFQLFDRTVSSPHTMCFYVDSPHDMGEGKSEYVYNGAALTDVRETLPRMRCCASRVREAVNAEIARRIRDFYPAGEKLQYQSPKPWLPNASFVNCYDGGKESVGYHSDQLTYLGPRAVIGSLSLGVAREFRVRKVVARDGDGDSSTDNKNNDNAPSTDAKSKNSTADQQGQISIHLPHNSLLVMHAEMQEEWKHSIAPVQAIDPHPIAGNKRINITYRYYRPLFHPKYTPRCRCGIATVLRCVQRKKETRGRYVWMCHSSYVPERQGCAFFEWAVFDDDGEPPWAKEVEQVTADTSHCSGQT